MRSVRDISEAASLKLCWNLLSSDSQWSSFLKATFFREGASISHFISSTIWCSIKPHLQTAIEKSKWVLGDGKSINFWLDSWLPDCPTITELLNLPSSVLHLFKSTVSTFISENSWKIPAELSTHHPAISDAINKVFIPVNPGQDVLA